MKTHNLKTQKITARQPIQTVENQDKDKNIKITHRKDNYLQTINSKTDS